MATAAIALVLVNGARVNCAIPRRCRGILDCDASGLSETSGEWKDVREANYVSCWQAKPGVMQLAQTGLVCGTAGETVVSVTQTPLLPSISPMSV